MNIELIVGLLAGAFALVAGALAVWGQIRSTRLSAEMELLKMAEQRRIESEKAVARYREPLARAAYDLQSRLYNLLAGNMLSKHYINGDERARNYVVDNTVYLIAQYLAWTEIIRTDIQFINLGKDEDTRQLARLQDNLYAIFQSSETGSLLRLFAGEQRAIGERMLCKGERGQECMGYAAFLDRLAENPDPLIEALRADVHQLAQRLPEARPRLLLLQHALIDLLAFLDPDFIRFPKERRGKVPA